MFLSSGFREDEGVDSGERLVGLEAHDSEGKGVLIFLDFTKMEEATLGANEEVLEPLLSRVGRHAMSRPSASTGDDEELAVALKPFVSMAVAAEEQARLLELKKGAGEVDLDLLARTNHPAVGEWRLVAADNHEVNFSVLLKSLKFPQIPSGLFLALFLGQAREV
jgi:hypothetical protein